MYGRVNEKVPELGILSHQRDKLLAVVAGNADQQNTISNRIHDISITVVESMLYPVTSLRFIANKDKDSFHVLAQNVLVTS